MMSFEKLPTYQDPAPMPLGNKVRLMKPSMEPRRSEIKEILWSFAFISGAVLLNRLGSFGQMAFFGVLMGMLFYGPLSTFKALSICCLATVSNQTLTSIDAEFWTIGKFAIIGASSLLLLGNAWQRSLHMSPHFWWLMGFLLAAVMGALINQYYLSISLLKSGVFGLGTTGLLIGVLLLRGKKRELTSWVAGLALFVAFFGWVSLLFNFGYNAKSVGEILTTHFNGALFHPNTMGTIGAILATLVSGLIFFGRLRTVWLGAAIVGSLLVFIWLSESRTGFGAALAGLGLSAVCAITQQSTRLSKLSAERSRSIALTSIALVGAGLLVVNLLNPGIVTDALFKQIYKGAAGETAEGLGLDAILYSRVRLIEQAIGNFREKPLLGIGFGTSTDPTFIENAGMFSAPTEKGSLVIGVLEETGILGGILITGFVVSLCGWLYRDKNWIGLSTFVTFLTANMGEMMFFSFGGAGGIAWCLCAGAIVCGDGRVLNRSKPRRIRRSSNAKIRQQRSRKHFSIQRIQTGI